MARQILIRCNTDLTLSQATEKIERLLNVKCELRNTSYGDSFVFSCMGLDGAIYCAPIEAHVEDRRLESFSTVIDVGLYASPLGKAHDEFDALHNIALFIAGIVARHLEWPSFICSEENNVMDEVSLPDDDEDYDWNSGTQY